MPYGPRPTPRGAHPAKAPAAEKPGAQTVQVTVDLSAAEYQLLNLWLARASLELDQPVSTMTVSRGIKAMIQATAADNAVNAVVLDVMRKEQP